MTGAPRWRRSSYCASGECVEARPAVNGRMVWLRRYLEHGELWQVPMTRAEWDAFLAGVKAGEFDDV